MEKQGFVTSDIWLSAALVILLNIYPEFHVKNNRTLFIFPADKSTYEAISKYNNGCQLNVFKFAETAKQLKFEALSRRSMSFDRVENSKVSAIG